MNFENAIEPFKQECLKRNITLFNSKIILKSEQACLDTSDFLDFCTINNIQTVFIYTILDEGEESLDFDSLKTELTKYFNQHFQIHKGLYDIKYIPNDFYTPILNNILKKAEEDITEYNEKIMALENESKDNDDESVSLIIAYTSFNGCIVSSYVYFKEIEDDESEEDSEGENDFTYYTNRSILEKYKKKIEGYLMLARKAALRKSKSIIQEMHNALLQEIKQKVADNPAIPTMKTQKTRNEYADRLYSALHEQEENGWITKKTIREIVDRAYFNSSEFKL